MAAEVRSGDKKVRSLKWQMVGIVLFCWLVPVVLVLGAMGAYVSTTLSQGAMQNLDDQFSLSLRLCGDRLESAVTASRAASADPTIKNAWRAYTKDGNTLNLYASTRGFLDRQYRTDGRFHFAVFWFTDDPQNLRHSVSLGVRYEQLQAFWSGAQGDAIAMAETLDTSVGFLHRGGQLYLVRNIMDSTYHPIGVLALALNLTHFFGDLGALPWASSITADLGGSVLQLRGDVPMLPPGSHGPSVPAVAAAVDDGDFTLNARAAVDYDTLLSQMSGYRTLLAGLLLLLVPLLLVSVHFFNSRISRPIQAMMDGAAAIEAGKLGHQLTYAPNTLEFQYLTDSFNHMSGELMAQFEHIFQEELALRDAKIKALQSHINPHFLNNTLEIINWEARMSGDAKVSKMIEALSTVLDAAIARDKRSVITLGEEMAYVNAYLYIIGERFGKRVTVTQDIDPRALERAVPRLILQPVIENAVEHGVGPGGQGGISLTGFLEEDTLILEIHNDGTLTDEDRAHIRRLLGTEPGDGRESSGNIGIANVDQRLRILCGPGSGLTIEDTGTGRVVARLTISPKQAL